MEFKCSAFKCLILFIALRSKGNSKRALQVTGSGKSLHDPVSMYEDETMASLKDRLEEVCTCSVYKCVECVHVCSTVMLM